MLRQAMKLLSPALRMGSMVVSVGSNGFLMASEWVLMRGVPPRLFNYTHHAISLIGLALFLKDAGTAEDALKPIDTLCRVSFILASMVFFELTRRSNPGIIPKQSERPTTPHGDKFHVCESCNIVQPYRSFHCRKCDHCVERFDHHCVWTNCCIGAKNLRYLVGLLATSVVGMTFCLLRTLFLISFSTSTIESMLLACLCSLYLMMLYPVASYFCSLVYSISINITAAELKGKINNTNEYLIISPYFNAWDFGTDFNIRACFNGYTMERPRWIDPSPFTKLLALVAANAQKHGAHGHGHGHGHSHKDGEACDHPPGAHQHGSSSHGHSAPHSASSARVSPKPIGDQNV